MSNPVREYFELPKLVSEKQRIVNGKRRKILVYTFQCKICGAYRNQEGAGRGGARHGERVVVRKCEPCLHGYCPRMFL